jgi:hypothetical protein
MVTQHGALIQQAYDAARDHAARSKGPCVKEVDSTDPAGQQPLPRELPTIPSELTSGLLHCLSTLPDPWPLAKITINGKCQSMGLTDGKTLFC